MTTIDELKKIAANERPSFLRHTLMDAAAELESLTALVETMKENIIANGQLFEARDKALTARVKELESYKDKLEGKANQKDVTTALTIALSGVALGICSLIVAIVK